MPATRDLMMLDPQAVLQLPGLKTVKKVDVLFAKKAAAAADFKKAQTTWIQSVKAPAASQPAAKPVAAVQLTADHVDKLRAVNESTAATAELVAQGLGPDDTVGILYSSLATLQYTQLKSEFKTRLAAAKDDKSKAAVNAQWQQVVKGAQGAFAAAGLANVQQAGLDTMATELARKKASFNAVTTIANSAINSVETTAKKAVGNFVTQVGVAADLIPIIMPFPLNICTKPLQGSFTKHFSKSFSLQVSLTVWCPTWTNPFRTCKKTFTLAGVSFSVDLSVGYSISCCGATAWGSAAAQACATIIGISVCANCTATITAVAGTGKSGSGSNCSYGLGLNAELKCSFAGITIFDFNVPFGWTITGPCLPICVGNVVTKNAGNLS